MFKTQNRLRQKSERDKVRERGDARTTQKTRSSNETFLSESGDDTGGRWSVLQQKTRVRLNIAETTQSSVEVDDIPLSFFSIFFLCCFLSFKEVSSAQRTLYSFRAQRNVRPRNSVWSIEIIKHLYSSVRMASGTDCQLYTGFCVSCSMDCVFTATDMYFWMAKTKPNGQSCFLFNGQYSFSNREKGDGQ